MGIPRPRCLFPALVLVVAGAALACAEASSPAPPREPSAYPQQAYGQPGVSASATSGGMVMPNFAEPPATDIAGNVAQLDRAELALTQLLGPEREAPRADHDRVADDPASKLQAQPLGQPADACSIACAALASMRRSAEHLCGMTGDKDTLCDSAKTRVDRAQQRVTAVCPACAGN